MSVTAKQMEIIVKLSCGTKVRAYFASQILAFTVCHEVNDVVPKEFDITARKYSFSANILMDGVKRTCRMKGSQLPERNRLRLRQR
jgi:hypothetical protein